MSQVELSAIKYSLGSQWFRKFQKECAKISKHIRFKRIKNGFFRIYFKNAYLHEVCKDMAIIGYDIVEPNPRFESREYYEEYEDFNELPMKIKNYREGYYDALDTIRKRVFLSRTQKEYHENSVRAYKQVKIK